MKRITLFALLMGAALCASAATANGWIVTKVSNASKGEANCRVIAPGTTPKVYTVKRIKTNEPAPEGFSNVTLAAGDLWEDGSGYQMLLDADAIAYGTIFPETGPLSTDGDVSADVYSQFEFKIPENADGAMNTTNIVINGEATIQIPAGVYDYCITNPTPGDRVWIASDNGGFKGRADDYEFESGVSYIITLSIHGSEDGAEVEIFDPSAPEVPTDLAVESSATFAEVTWTAGANNDVFNLRYREFIDPLETNILIYLPDENSIEKQLEYVQIFDADGDGHNWGLAYSDDSQTDICFYSASYENTQAYYPDNWLIIKAALGGTLRFKAKNYSSTWPDNLGVFVYANSELESVDDFVHVGEDIVPPADAFTQYEFDLSAYEGLGYVAIRHYNSDDNFGVYVDDIEIIVPDGREIPEWIVLHDVTSPYIINDLTPATNYEVQVQGLANDVIRALKVSNWSESTQFTTLEDDVPTGIVDVNVAQSKSGQRYNVMGQPVGNDYKGIVIEDGKKLIVR